jgi:spore germination cell wall hydrolase CwlJ-like protein
MNRVFSPFYPNDVCGVIYQNAHRHLSCQFTFTCDGRPERVTERRSWRRAKYIAKRTLDGKTWVAEVAKSTHYHAVYVRPRWVREMKRMVRYGVHAFYRPRKWGDGSRETDWSNISNIAARAVIVE